LLLEFLSWDVRNLLPPPTVPVFCFKVRGPKAVPLLRARVAREGVTTFWRGTGATMLAAAVGHYPWY
jgi:hypothetical protein